MRLALIINIIFVTLFSTYIVMATYERSFSSRLPLKQKIDEIAQSGYEAIENLYDTSTDLVKKMFGSEEKTYTVYEYQSIVHSQGDSTITQSRKTLPSDAHIIKIEKITNVGYTFYLGKIDYPDSDPISDNVKNQITKSIATAHFPQRLLDRMSIIITNSLAATPKMYIETPKGLVQIDNFNPNFLSEGGQYRNYDGKITVILLNKDHVDSPQKLNEIFTHELGHDISNELSADEWKEFYRLRGIPEDTPRYGTGNWNMTPNEDFAEVYMHVFTGGAIKTKYGLLEDKFTAEFGSGMDMGPCQKMYFDVQSGLMTRSHKDLSVQEILSLPSFKTISKQEILTSPVLQKCRREHLDSYVGTVDEEVRNFVIFLKNNLR